MPTNTQLAQQVASMRRELTELSDRIQFLPDSTLIEKMTRAYTGSPAAQKRMAALDRRLGTLERSRLAAQGWRNRQRGTAARRLLMTTLETLTDEQIDQLIDALDAVLARREQAEEQERI
jgi:hypothetical protein